MKPHFSTIFKIYIVELGFSGGWVSGQTHGVWWGHFLYKGIYKDVPMEWVDFFSFDRYDWVVDLSLQYINGWVTLSYDISIGHISTSSWCFILSRHAWFNMILVMCKIDHCIYIVDFILIYELVHSFRTSNNILIYSQSCIKRSPLGQRKSGLIR